MDHDKKESGKIQSAEMQFIRNILNYTLQDRIRNKDTNKLINVFFKNEMINLTPKKLAKIRFIVS